MWEWVCPVTSSSHCSLCGTAIHLFPWVLEAGGTMKATSPTCFGTPAHVFGWLARGGEVQPSLASTCEASLIAKQQLGLGEYISVMEVQKGHTATYESYKERIIGTEAVSFVVPWCPIPYSTRRSTVSTTVLACYICLRWHFFSFHLPI